MDPGNWATDLAGGSRFGYALLSVILISNLMAVLLQGLASKLGIVTGRDLAQACRDHYSTPVVWVLWVLCEIAIAACDLAEVIGSAIALNLFFGIALPVGVAITALDVLLLLYLQNKGVRVLEALVITLVATSACASPSSCSSRDPISVTCARIPADDGHTLRSREALHRDRHPRRHRHAAQPLSALVHRADAQVRRERRRQARGGALRLRRFDDRALVRPVHQRGHPHRRRRELPHQRHTEVAEIQDAYKLLTPLLGAGASTAFALALLASGQNSTLTGTLAGQIVMEGFLNIRIRPWLRRLITRLIAIIPAVIVSIIGASRDGQAADPQPGDPEPAAVVRRLSAGNVHLQQAQDG
jgi:manganese transport protein